MPWAESKVNAEFLSRKGGSLDDRITQHKFANKHCFEEFIRPVMACADLGGGAATGTAGDVNILCTGRNVFEYHIKGTQTIVAPVVTTEGLNIGMDQTDNDGVELTPGIIANERHWGTFKVGTDAPFFCRAKIKIEDVSGSDDLCVGFRKAEAYQANVDDYDEGAWLQVNAGTINWERILNNGATSTTDTTADVADAGTVTLEVRVGSLDGSVGARRVTVYVDGVQKLASTSFSFDSGEFVIPFIFFLHAADVAGEVEVIEWEFGYQSTKPLLD